MQIGEHTVGFEAPDLVVTTYRGVISEQDAREMSQFIVPHTTGLPYVLSLVDASEFRGISEDGRYAIREFVHVIPFRGIACHSANFTIRTLGTIMVRALNLISGRDCPIVFPRNEAEARAWLIERRKQIAANLDRNTDK